MKIPDLLEKSIFKKSITNKQVLSSDEAFNIWDTLRARYTSIETHQIFINFVHDRDLELILNNHLKLYNNQRNILENLAEKFAIPIPKRPPESISTSANIDAITDKTIYRRIRSDLISQLYSLNKTVISCLINDNLRSIFTEFINGHLESYKNFHKYGKLKGWAEIAPAYKTKKPVDNEQLSTSEAAHLFNLVNIRYDQIHLTLFFLEMIHDKDFKQIVKRGISILNNQLNDLEKILNKNEVPLPERPPAHQKIKIDPEVINDNFIFRTLFSGIRDAINMHIRSLIETIRNDELRDFFYELYEKEINIFDNFVKYGNLKGWTNPTPKYK